jgi:predicted nucleic-acid-binding protein
VIAVDTNVVVRFLTRDDQRQFEEAERCFRANNVLLPDTVLLETVWVLTSAYSFHVSAIVGAITKLLGLGNVTVRDPEAILFAVAAYERGLDFADALHLATCQDVERLLTFDETFSKRASGLGRCVVGPVAASAP